MFYTKGAVLHPQIKDTCHIILVILWSNKYVLTTTYTSNTRISHILTWSTSRVGIAILASSLYLQHTERKTSLYKMHKSVLGILLLWGLAVLLCQAVAKPDDKSSTRYPVKKRIPPIKYPESPEPQSHDSDPDMTITKKPYRTPRKSEYDRKRNHPRKKENFSPMYREKKHGLHGLSRKRHYDLGSRSGYRWMLYGSPLDHNYGHDHVDIPRGKVRSHWRRYAHHLAPKYAFLPSHYARRHARYGYRRSAVGRVGGRPIVVSIHPSFKAYNMRSASVLGYGLDSLLHDVVLASKLKSGKQATKAAYT